MEQEMSLEELQKQRDAIQLTKEEELAINKEIAKTLDSAVTAPQIYAAMEAEKKIGELTKPETKFKIVPIELKNINLLVELAVPENVEEQFKRTQELVAKIREKFGPDAMVEELSQLVCGTIQKVVITTKDQPYVSVPKQEPVQVNIPTKQSLGDYCIQSNQCPWHMNALKMLDPVSIYKVLTDQRLSSLMTQQDLTMMNSYYTEWYNQQQKQVASGVVIHEDNIPF